MSVTASRDTHPRLFRAPDDPDFTYPAPTDPNRQQILANLLADAGAWSARRPWTRLPERLDSPHPYHQLYITFYTAMTATALIEQYAFAWKMTGEKRWLDRAKKWMLAAAAWEHSDRIEEHFYTANRYMQAFAYGLDILHDQLTSREEQKITDCLIGQMERWWPDVNAQRASPSGGHHAVVDNGHFGVAALHLLGKHSDAPKWVDAVIERFRAAIMVVGQGCGPDGEPVDGPSFWPWENLWMLHFCDALINVTGVDLYAEFRQRCLRPLNWFRYQLVDPDRAMGAGSRAVWSPTVLRLAQEAGYADLRQLALEDPDLGRIYRFHAGVKGSSAECIIAYGPYAYCYFDPAFRARRTPPLRLSTSFKKSSYGETAVMRDRWSDPHLVLHATGYSGRSAHAYSSVEVEWGGQSLFKSIACEEAQPVSCGNVASVGGQNEYVARLSGLKQTPAWDRLRMTSTRLDQEFWLLRGEAPVLLLALRRRRRGRRHVTDADGTYARLDGRDYLQYAREPWFNPEGGELRLRVRLGEKIDPARRYALFNTGLGLGEKIDTRGNNFGLGFFNDAGLAFGVQSQHGLTVHVRMPPARVRMKPGTWHDVAARWGGFNDPKGRPFMELEVDGEVERCDDESEFGELNANPMQLEARDKPRTFYAYSRTAMAFGAGVLLPDTGTRCDIARIELRCKGRAALIEEFSGASKECGSGELLWKLNPVELKSLRRGCARLLAAGRAAEIRPVYPANANLRSEVVPFAPSGLAAGSLKALRPGAEQPSTRVLASAGDEDLLVVAVAPASSRVKVQQSRDGFELSTGSERKRFSVGKSGTELLRLH